MEDLKTELSLAHGQIIELQKKIALLEGKVEAYEKVLEILKIQGEQLW